MPLNTLDIPESKTQEEEKNADGDHRDIAVLNVEIYRPNSLNFRNYYKETLNASCRYL